MPARKPCNVSGCPELSEGRTGSCAAHTKVKPHTWGSSNRTKPGDWREDRKRILDRSGHTCVRCGGFASIADHLVPQAWGGTESDSNKRAMCVNCHDRKTAEESKIGRRLTTADEKERRMLIGTFVNRWRGRG